MEQAHVNYRSVAQRLVLASIGMLALVLLAIIASVLILFRLLTPQFVTLRALGAPRRYVFAIAWGFTASLMASGVALGLAGGYALSFAVSAALARNTGVALQPALGEAELLMALAMLVIGLLLATLPAWRLQRVPLAQAMKDY